MKNKLIFILGIQRSGTTWLVNIFDSSPRVLLFMEPFAPDYRVFPEFPPPEIFFEHSVPDIENLLRTDFEIRLRRFKRLIFKNSPYNPALFNIEKLIASRIKRYVPYRYFMRIQKFEHLNLNRLEAGFKPVKKDKNLSTWVIKELRLAGKIPILLNAFPDARFIVIIRHPVATVYSILNWWKKGRLGELKQMMTTFVEVVAAQKISQKYEDKIALSRKKNSKAFDLALYWLISYEEMISRLKKHPHYKLLVYEQLASDPVATVQDIFQFVELPVDDSVMEYISFSSTASGATSLTTPINTVRDSKTYYKAWTKQVDPDIEKDVMECVKGSPLMELFAKFY